MRQARQRHRENVVNGALNRAPELGESLSPFGHEVRVDPGAYAFESRVASKRTEGGLIAEIGKRRVIEFRC